MRFFSSPQFASLVLASFISMSAMGQTAPVISVPGGGSEAAFWFFGNFSQDYPGCCSDMLYKYWTEWPVYIALNTADPSPTVVWYWTNNDETGNREIQFIDQVNSGSSPRVTMQSLNPSSGEFAYDITIYATVDGVQSNSISVMVNAPYFETNTTPAEDTSSWPGQCVELEGAGYYGYIGYSNKAFYDINGDELTPIDTAETLENWTQYPMPGGNWPAPTASVWHPSSWSGDTLSHDFELCEGGPGGDPNASSWDTSGGTLAATETQKWWVGTTVSNFEGYCTEADEVSFYSSYAALPTIDTPVYGQGNCASGQFLN